MNKEEITSLQDKYVLHTYNRDTIMVRGEGSYLWDIDGKKYIDLTVGIGVCNLGHCYPRVTDRKSVV